MGLTLLMSENKTMAERNPGRVLMVVVADAHDEGLDFTGRRDRFTCTDFTYTIAPDERSGTVLLLPENRSLRVGEAISDYARVCVFSTAGKPIGCMTCALDARVTWSFR